MADDEDPYESMPSGSTMSTHMVAGAAAGVMEHCVMYPIDCVKTRMQCLVPNPRANYRNVPDALVKIMRNEGLKSTVRGINAVVGGAGPAHALYFACYEKLKAVFSGGQANSHLAYGAAGCVATLLHDAVMNPADVIKQRMQVYESPYRSCLHCFNTIWKEEGMAAFYRSYTTQLTMNIPFQSIHFVTYEYMQEWLNSDRAYNPQSHIFSGAAAGAVAASITMPLDVCKTLLNTQEQCARSHINYINGMSAAFRTVYEFQGFRGFFRGLQARVVYQMPSTAISWSVYEFFKYFLTNQQTKDDAFVRLPSTAAASAGPSVPLPSSR